MRNVPENHHRSVRDGLARGLGHAEVAIRGVESGSAARSQPAVRRIAGTGGEKQRDSH
jgi:hypothetical protein